MNWPEITKDTSLEELKRIHQDIWQYVVDHGEKPSTPYIADCALCEYVTSTNGGCFPHTHFDKCPVKWEDVSPDIACTCGLEFYNWWWNMTKDNASVIRDILFKYELEDGK